MTIEEKAKRYDELLLKLQKGKVDDNVCDEMYYRVIDDIVPELAKSEDERIRKEIIAFLKENHETGRADETWSLSGLERWIDWLEKQDKCETDCHHSHQDANYPKGGIVMEDFNEGNGFYKVNLAYLNEEQVKEIEGLVKKWNTELKDSEDEKIRKRIINALHGDVLGMEETYKAIAWLEKQGEQEEPQVYKTEDGEIITYSETDGYKVEQKFKDGDVLYSPTHHLIWIYKDNEHFYACVNMNYVTENVATNGLISIPNDACLATKDEQTILFARMKDAGYEWDAKLKQLRKIEDEIEIPFGAKDSELQEATYNIPKGFHAEIDDDKVVVKKGEKPTAWSEEDERQWNNIYDVLDGHFELSEEGYSNAANWLKAIKGRVQPKSKQEWSKDDKVMLDDIIDFFENGTVKLQHDLSLYASWLKSLKQRYTWKPSDEQIKALEHFVRSIGESGYASHYDNNTKLLYSLLEQLKKLK